MSEVGSTLWTILRLTSILILEAEKGSTLVDERFSSILVATSWDSWIVLGDLSLRIYPIFLVKDLV
jgi:hypothetical protein